MKKKLLLAAVLVMVFAILGTGTMAYFRERGTMHNVVTSSGVRVKLNETMLDASGKEVPFVDQADVMPTDVLSKIVRVKNLQEEAYIRVKVNISIQNKQKELNADVAQVAYGNDAYNTKDWELKSDGWYYYRKALSSKEETAPLFEKVVFDGVSMGNEYQGCKVAVNVTVQAVQTANNEPKTAGDFSTVSGWPK